MADFLIWSGIFTTSIIILIILFSVALVIDLSYEEERHLKKYARFYLYTFPFALILIFLGVFFKYVMGI